MAQFSYEPSGTDVSKAESDIAQTLSLAGSIVTLVREPIALIYQNIASGKKLKRSLGAWQEEALDDGGQCRIPLIRHDKFEEYLVKNDGIVPAAPQKAAQTDASRRWSLGLPWASGQRSPSPSSGLARVPEMPPAGAACWAYLLYALGIHPGMSLVEWRPPEDGIVSTQNGGIEMEVDGSVLCHIMNLYSAQLNGSRWSRYHTELLPDRRLRERCGFDFGELAWAQAGDQLHAHFVPGPENALGSAKRPFGLRESDMEEGTIIASYLTALVHGSSDPDLRLASPTEPLLDRIQTLTSCFRGMQQHRRTPVFISYDWFEEASRIKRRVLAQGGYDHSFLQDIEKTSEVLDGRRVDPSSVRSLFLLDAERFTIELPGSQVGSAPSHQRSPLRAAEQTLMDYASQPPGSWKRGLFDMKEEVLEVLFLKKTVVLTEWWNMHYIEFTTSCDIWHKKVLLGAPVHAEEKSYG